MPRGDRSRHPYRGVSGTFRGTVGYSGVSADAQNDPAVVFPPRPVTVPAAATMPLQAGSDSIEAGGGVTNSAPAGSVAVSDGTDITGSANLTWDDVGNVLGLAAAENGGGTIDAGGIVIETGFATDGASGDIDIRVDPNDLSGTGGNVLIQAGTGQTGSGGDVFISAGSAVTSGTNGSVQILDGSGHSIEMNPSGMFLLGGVVVLDSLPTADPVNAGQVWNDAGTLKVSAG
jgi:hypothetical protein